MITKRSEPATTWDGTAPCGVHGADFQGQPCTVCKPFRELPLADRRRLTRLARGLTVLLSNAPNLQRLGLVDVAPRAAGRPLVTLSDRGRRCILAAEASGYDTRLTAGQLEGLKEKIHAPLCPQRTNPQRTCTCRPPAVITKRSVKLRGETILAAIGRFDGVDARDLADALEIPAGDKLARNALAAHLIRLARARLIRFDGLPGGRTYYLTRKPRRRRRRR